MQSILNKKKNLIYTLLIAKKFSKDQLRVTWQPKKLELPVPMLGEIERLWQTLAGYYNGQIARLEDWHSEGKNLFLTLRPTEYKILLYSNRYVNHIISQWGEKYLSRALGISANVVTKDNKLLLMQRSAHVGEYAHHYDVFGGHIDCPSDGSSPDVFAAMAKELKEELAVAPERIILEGIGLIAAHEHQKPELLFIAQVDYDSAEIFKNYPQAMDRHEYNRIFSIENDKYVINMFLKSNKERISPSAYGCLSVYTRYLQ